MFKFSKKVWIPLVTIFSAIVLTVIVLIVLTNTIWKVKLTVSAEQVENSQNIKVKWKISKEIDNIEIKVKHDGNIISSVVLSNPNDVFKGEYEIPAYYGKHIVSVSVSNKLFTTTEKQTVKVFADEYNIAPITATMPVTIFSLSLMDKDNGIINNAEGNPIPTFVWFKRSEAWDYTNMPENVYTMPMVNSNRITANADQSEIYSNTSKWVKELYEINSNSKFNFFYNDYFAYGWLQATIANGIPQSNYKVVLLSDGTASFSYFNKHFDNENYATNYAKMVEKYNKLKTQIKSRKSYKEQLINNFEIDANTIREYAYIMAKEEPNVEWWLTRVSGTMATNCPEMQNQINDLVSAGKIKVKDLKSLLFALTTEEQASLKQLYNFSDTMFEKASNENKKIMVILGTWTDTENKTNFDEYVKAVQKYYGNDYVYYYKGHPRNPTNSVKGKLEHLNSLNLIDVDSTIAAELIFFFNPDAYCTGYQSTTFVSLDDEHSCGIFNVRKDSFTESYKNNIDFFISMVESTDTKYGSLVDKKSCLLEFVKATEYDIAIYDDSKNSMKYYKYNNETSSYDFVK